MSINTKSFALSAYLNIRLQQDDLAVRGKTDAPAFIDQRLPAHTFEAAQSGEVICSTDSLPPRRPAPSSARALSVGNGRPHRSLADKKQDEGYPSQYDVFLDRDNKTPKDYMVSVISRYFNKSADEAEKVVDHAFRNGNAMIGTYTYDVASTRVERALNEARSRCHNKLTLTCEKS